MSSHQIPANSGTVAVNYATMGSLPSRFNMPQGSLHQRLPSAFILLEEDPFTFEQSHYDVLDCLVGGSSATPLLTLCMAFGNVCLYWVFNPLDPKTRAHLEVFRREQAFPFIGWDGEQAVPYAVQTPIFDRGLLSTRGRNPASHGDWLAQARVQAGALPGIYASALASVAHCRDHRVFLMVADDSIHLRAVERMLLLSAVLNV